MTSPRALASPVIACAAIVLAGCALDPLPMPTASADAGAPLGPPVVVSGQAFVFGLSGGRLEGATISSVEAPDRTATVAADGTFSLTVPSEMKHSFLARLDGYQDTQTATFDVGPAGLDRVGFQVPTTGMVALLSATLNLTPDPERCQIATTVSAPGTAPYGGAGLGEPDVVVSIDPPLPEAQGPVYFRYVNESLIVPDRALSATSIDGGVLYLNVPPGAYVLSATKPGRTIPPVTITCRAGLLVNAAPPRGLQVE